MKKIIAVILIFILTSPSLSAINSNSYPSSHENYTEIEIIPHNHTGNFTGPELITLSIYVTPQNNTDIDTVSTDLITFTPDTLQCEEITWGNLFDDATFRIKGTIDNNAGTITDMVWGSTQATQNPGYFCNMTFNITSAGAGGVIIDTDYAGVAYGASPFPFVITHNFSLGTDIMFISDEYPVNESLNNPLNLQLGVDIYHSQGKTMDLYWSSNTTGEVRQLDVDNGLSNGRYTTSCYGVIESPYNQELFYPFSDYSSNIYHNNSCPAHDLGDINSIKIHTEYTGTIQPIFDGYIEGEYFSVSGDTYTDITSSDNAPTIWTWEDVKNLDLYSTSTGNAEIIVVYDLGYGEGERIDWTVSLTDGDYWVNKSFWYITEIESPIISNPSPYDTEIWDYYHPELSVDVIDPNGDMMDVSFYWDNGTGWEQIGTTQAGGNNTYVQQSLFSTYNEIFYWKVSADDRNGHVTNMTYRVTLRDVQDSPYSFDAQTWCDNQINISWVKPEHVDSVRIQRRTDTYPTTINDGLNIYNGTGTSYGDVLVNPGTKYFYSAWSWNNTDKTWSITKSNSVELTAPSEVTGFTATTIDYETVDLNWNKGTGALTTLIRKKIGSYPTSQSDGSVVYEGDATNFTDTGLGSNVTYYYRAWAHYHSGIYEPKFENDGEITGYCESGYTYCGHSSQCTQDFTVPIGESLYCTKISVYIGHWALGAWTGGSHYRARIYLSGPEIDTIQIGYEYSMDNPAWRTYSVPNIYLKGGETYTVIVKWDDTCSPSCCYCPCVRWAESGGSKLYKVYGYYGYYSCEYDQDLTTTDVGPPLVTTNEATTLENYTATINGYLDADGGESTTVGFIWENESGNYNTTLGTYDMGDFFSLNINGLTKGTTYSFKTWAENTYGYVEGDELLFNTRPVEPTSIKIDNYSFTEICLSWNNGLGSDETMIRYKTGSYPVDVNDGQGGLVCCYNNSCITDLNPNATYYFRIWSYNISENLYSSLYDQTIQTTLVGAPVIDTISPINIESFNATIRATLTDDTGEACTCGFRWGSSSGSYTNNQTVGSSYTTGQTVSLFINSLSKGTTYYYQSWGENSGGFSFGDEVSFATRPVEPSGFTANNYGALQINLSWTNNDGTDSVMIRRSQITYPDSISNGDLVFEGSTNLYEDSTNENETWYYSIWSYNNSNELYSHLYDMATDKTSWLPNITYMSPCSTVNEDRIVTLEARAEGNDPLTYYFYEYDGDTEILGEYADGSYVNSNNYWQNVNNVLSYSGYANGRYQAGGSWSWNFITPLYIGFENLPFEDNEPRYINGIEIDDNFGNSPSYQWEDWSYAIRVSFHNYETDSWITYTRDDGEDFNTFELPEPKWIDQVYVRYGFHFRDGTSTRTISPNVNSIEFTTEPRLLCFENGKISNELGTCVYTNATRHLESYAWSFKVFDGIDSVTQICSFDTEGVTLSDATPTSSNTPNTQNHTCSVQINHSGGDILDVTFYYYDSGWIQGGQNSGVGNGTYQFIYPDSNELSTEYQWAVVVYDGIDYYNKTYTFTVRDAYTPDSPDFNLNNVNATTIDINGITWDGNTDEIMIRASTIGYPSDRTEGTLLYQGLITDYTHNNLYPNTQYYYTIWAHNFTDDVWSSPSTDTLSTLGPVSPSYILSKQNKSIINIEDIQFNDIYSDTILIRAKSGSYPNDRSDGMLVMNSTFSSFSHEGLNQATDYYYSAWAYDADTNWWSGSTDKHQKTNGPPSLSNFDPTNGEKIDGINPRLMVTVDEYNDEDSIDVYFRSNYSGGWTTIHHENSLEGMFDYYSSEFSYQDYNYWWSVNVTDGEFWASQILNFETGSMNVPQVTATTYNVSQINLSWEKADWTTHTWIQRKIDGYPTSRTDGTNIYFGTDEYFEDTNLNPGELYRYSIWSYNATLGVYSTEISYTQNLTKPYGPMNFTATKWDYTSINLSWEKGQGAENTVIVYKPDNYPVDRFDGTEIYRNSGTWHLATGLKPDDYLNYYSPLPGTDNFGVYIGGGDPFEYSCDDNTATKWDLNESTVGNFSYELGVEPQRVKGFAILYQDFYDEEGTDWESSITGFDVYNGSWHNDWTGELYNNNESTTWYYHESDTYYNDVTEVRFSAWTEWITPDIYEVLVGKLGYVHCFKAWSVVTKGGITQYSDEYTQTENKTSDTPPNEIPEILDMNPPDTTTGLDPNPMFNVTIQDPEGQLMNISWQYWNGTKWLEFNTTTLVGNGTYSVGSDIFTSFGTTYNWRVNVSDTSDVKFSAIQENTNTSDEIWFTIRNAFIPDTPFSFNAETAGFYEINLSMVFTSDMIYIERNTSADWSRGDGVFIYQGNLTEYQDTGLDDGVNYYYQIWGYNITDGVYSVSYLLDNATTLERPNDPPYEPISGYVTTPRTTDDNSYLDVYQITMHCLVSDPDGDSLNVSFYWSDNTLIGTVTDVENNTEAELFIPLHLTPAWLSHDTTYEWYAIADDGEFQNQSTNWDFHTCYSWDLNVDKLINYLDISIMVAHYLNAVSPPGSETYDVNNDGTTNYLDLSSVVSHYLESY